MQEAAVVSLMDGAGLSEQPVAAGNQTCGALNVSLTSLEPPEVWGVSRL